MGGLLAGALWWRQRDPLYGCFSLAALAGILRYLDPLLQPAPLPWPLWGGVLAVAYGLHLGLIARFIFLVLERNPRWLVRGIHAALLAVVLLAAASFAFSLMALWTAALALLLLMGLVCLVVVLQEAWRRGPGIAWIVLGAGGLLLAAGAHDLLRVRTGIAGSGSTPLVPHALFAFVLILSGIFVHRFNRSVAAHRALAASLAERVAEREQQLRQAFDALRVQRDEQATAAERTRIMREIHDGIGAQLVGLLNMVGDERNDRGVLQQQVRLALDEMRLAVDSLQPVFGELTAVLATLRYRLQPRLAAAGIELVWDMAALPVTALPSAQVGAAPAAHPARGLHQRAQARPGHACDDAGALAGRAAGDGADPHGRQRRRPWRRRRCRADGRTWLAEHALARRGHRRGAERAARRRRRHRGACRVAAAGLSGQRYRAAGAGSPMAGSNLARCTLK